MCGIAGIIGQSLDQSAISRMVKSMENRGPDDEGIFCDDQVAIGMTRLAIIDLSPLGHQPMQSHCGRYWIVYNGECYNFAEVRKKLEIAGEFFHSNSDTEVVLQAYARWGAGCLQSFNGMFSFAIWDTLEKTLFAARDRFGIKPFYYCDKNGGLKFASEIKTLLKGGVNYAIDRLAVFQFFTFGHVQQPSTIIEDVKSLMPGHYLIWRQGRVSISKYWDLGSAEIRNSNYEDAKSELLHLVRDSVKLQMISDRPLGLFLSGGLDSATVLAAMDYHGVPVKTFSIGFEDNPYIKNETSEAAMLANYFGTDHHDIQIDSSIIPKVLPGYFEALDQPSVDGLNTYLVSKYASGHMTVALNGLGGDELFAGYSRHSLLFWKNQHKRVQWMSRLIPLIAAIKAPHPISRLLWRSRVYGESDDFILNYTFARTLSFPSTHDNMFSNKLGATGLLDFYKYNFRELDIAYIDEPLRRILRMDLYSFLSSQLLRDMDAVSMAHSLEVRFPLIDHRLAEFAFALPDHFKLARYDARRPKGEGNSSYKENGAKKILMDCMEPLLPTGFLSRKKNGFKLPINYWLKQMNPSAISESINDRKDVWGPFCNERMVSRLTKSFAEGPGLDNSLWKLLTFIGVISSLEKCNR